MKRALLRGLLLVVALGANACGATQPQAGTMAMAPSATGSAPTPTSHPATAEATTSVAATTATTSGTAGAGAGDGAPVTPVMAKLGLSGERFQAIGDPRAPLTMIEFSDYG